jgi:DNA modification methylase
MNKKIMENQELQSTTVWSFPNRGKWLTHNAKYRGNWAPQVPNNIIRLYSNEGEVILDPMVGSGTTMIEAKSLGRRGIAFDIHPEIVELAQNNCNFCLDNNCFEPLIKCGDARFLDGIQDNSIDLIATHPPYLNIIKYGTNKIDGDLSLISNLNKFYDEIEKVAHECYRVLKDGRYCVILMGDTRRRRHYVPLAFSVMQRFLKAGFILKEDIIKIQHNCSTTRYWNSQKKDFMLIMHEHLFVFRKVGLNEDKKSFETV